MSQGSAIEADRPFGPDDTLFQVIGALAIVLGVSLTAVTSVITCDTTRLGGCPPAVGKIVFPYLGYGVILTVVGVVLLGLGTVLRFRRTPLPDPPRARLP